VEVQTPRRLSANTKVQSADSRLVTHKYYLDVAILNTQLSITFEG